MTRVSHGRATRATTVGPFIITEALYAPHQRVSLHGHRWPSWTLVLEGGFEERFSRDTVAAVHGAVVTKPGSAEHSNVYGPVGARCLLIETQDDDNRIGAPAVHTAGVVPRLARRIHAELRGMDRVALFALEALLIELGAATGRSPQSFVQGRKAWLNDVREQLEAEFRAPPSLTQLASARGVHPAYLCQAFRAAFGMSIGQFVRSVRFEWAREALRVGRGGRGEPTSTETSTIVDMSLTETSTIVDMSLADIAAAAGFSDQAHLTREFRKRAGVPPGRFRRT